MPQKSPMTPRKSPMNRLRTLQHHHRSGARRGALCLNRWRSTPCPSYMRVCDVCVCVYVRGTYVCVIREYVCVCVCFCVAVLACVLNCWCSAPCPKAYVWVICESVWKYVPVCCVCVCVPNRWCSTPCRWWVICE